MTVFTPPAAPESIEATGVGRKLLFDLILKLVHVEGLNTGSALAERSGLPMVLVGELIEEARQFALLESLGARGRDFSAELRYGLTGKGQDWAIEALERSHYVGPAPVSLEAFQAQVEAQRITRERVGPKKLAESFAHLVLADDLLTRLGPAINSGKSIFLYGRSGNGKTSIAEALRDAFDDTIAVPYCIAVGGQIINFFDANVHHVADDRPDSLGRGVRADRRWALCRRPVTMVGGELTLDMLDLLYDGAAKFYEAPAHLKAVGGVFLLDDFGRQRASAESILNRWVVPLERGVDYLSLRTGKKFPVPFDGIVIFSTNLRPSDLADEAMLRRLHYKIEVPEPSRDEYELIWERVCEARGIELPYGLISFVEEEYYTRSGITRAAYHPGYLVDQVAAMCEYTNRPMELTPELIDLAWRNMLAE